MSGSKLGVIAGTMRIPFLVLPPVCVALGTATAVYSGARVQPWDVILAFLGAFSAHISVNALNEYFDFKSGLDFKTERTPFSGGSGTLPQNPARAHLSLISGLITFGVTGLIGIYFIWTKGAWLLPIGLLGLLVIAGYTTIITKHPLLCLIAPGLGFGTLMVTGTHFVLSGTYSWPALTASMVPFFLVNNLLLLNQFPDVTADRDVGRKHYPIVIGRKKSALIYAGFLMATYVSVLIGFVVNLLPGWGFLSYASIILAGPTLAGVLRHADDMPGLMPSLGKNVVLNIVTPLLLAAGLIIDHIV